MFGLGSWEMGVIAAVILVLAGPSVLPPLTRRLGEIFVGVRSAGRELAETVHTSEHD
ncbi:MAG: twin-arginine translocase TatA/TatE family subunit [Myxococcota bacterium]